MSVLDTAKVHFNAQEMRRIEVPEWGEEDAPLVIFAKPFTLAEKQKLYKHAKNNELEVLVYTLILKALDSEGNKLFGLDDKHVLMHQVDPEVLTRVATEIHQTVSVQDLGNS